jgi:hypothetical protein
MAMATLAMGVDQRVLIKPWTRISSPAKSLPQTRNVTSVPLFEFQGALNARPVNRTKRRVLFKRFKLKQDEIEVMLHMALKVAALV